MRFVSGPDFSRAVKIAARSAFLAAAGRGRKRAAPGAHSPFPITLVLTERQAGPGLDLETRDCAKRWLGPPAARDRRDEVRIRARLQSGHKNSRAQRVPWFGRVRIPVPGTRPRPNPAFRPKFPKIPRTPICGKLVKSRPQNPK
jgi:hypothetical protein